MKSGNKGVGLKSKLYKDGIWIFVYYPEVDFLCLLFKGFRKGFWPYGTDIRQAIAESSSQEGREQFQLSRDWKSFIIDTDLTKDWRTAHAIATEYFNTDNLFAPKGH